MWREKYHAELKKSVMLRNACEDLREEFDLLNSERINIANKNFLPKYADARENPSRKVLWSIRINSLFLLIGFYNCKDKVDMHAFMHLNKLFCSQGNYKISALKMQYEIFVSTQWLDLKLRKLNFEEKVCVENLSLKLFLFTFSKK